jgi:hypothetical protein
MYMLRIFRRQVMQKLFSLLLIVVILPASCGLFKKEILIDAVVDQKAQIDATENPAMKNMINSELRDRRVQLFDLVVKDVTLSTNIDYDYCVIVDVQTKKGPVECFIYSTDKDTISKLVKGKSRIDASGDFGRFFSLLGDYYTMLEIVNAKIKIKG